MCAQLVARARHFFSSIFLRITRTRHITAYLVFTIVFCFIQAILLSLLFTLHGSDHATLDRLLRQGHMPDKNFAVLNYPEVGKIRLDVCSSVPQFQSFVDSECATVFNTGIPANQSVIPDSLFSPGFTFDVDGLPVAMEGSSVVIPLSGQCMLILLYPRQILQNLRREDSALIAMQFWLFIISFFGVVHESISQIVAVLCFRVLCAAWSSYSRTRTFSDLAEFRALIRGPESPCDPRIDVHETYIRSRQNLELPDLVVNLVGLVISIYLTYKLSKTYDQRGFNRVGAPSHIRKIYQLFLSGLAAFQLSVVFLAAGLGLWVDQLLFSPLARFANHRSLYLGLSIFALVMLLPWAALGWYSIRQERRRLMISFLISSVLWVGAWIVMFMSWSYRFTFIHWPFFAAIMSMASVSLFLSIVLAALSWWNFDKGLAHYLYVDSVLAKLNFQPDTFENDVEKGSADEDVASIITVLTLSSEKQAVRADERESAWFR